MKKYILIGLLAILILSCSTISDFSEKDIKGKENSILNSGFEEGIYHINSVPVNWTVLNKPSGVISWVEQTAHNSSRSMKIAYPPEEVSIISDSFPVDATSVHYSQCFIKADRPTQSQVGMRFLAFDAKGKKLNQYSKKITPKMDWTKIELTSSFFKPNVKYGRIVITIPRKSNTIFWLDNVRSYDVHRLSIQKN
jgi:hypothetical protein